MPILRRSISGIWEHPPRTQNRVQVRMERSFVEKLSYNQGNLRRVFYEHQRLDIVTYSYFM